MPRIRSYALRSLSLAALTGCCHPPPPQPPTVVPVEVSCLTDQGPTRADLTRCLTQTKLDPKDCVAAYATALEQWHDEAWAKCKVAP